MTTPVHAEPKQPVQSSHPVAPAPAASAAPEIKDNVAVREGVVLDPNASKPIYSADIPEEAPLLDSPENFKEKKKVVSDITFAQVVDIVDPEDSNYKIDPLNKQLS